MKMYRFRVRLFANSKWRFAPYPMTIEQAQNRYGVGNYELVQGTEVSPAVPMEATSRTVRTVSLLKNGK